MVYQSSPIFFWLFSIITIFHGLSWAVKVFFLQVFYDTTSNVINHNGNVNSIYMTLVLYGVVIILAEVLNGANNFLYLPFNQKCIGKLMQRVHLKVAKIPATEYENANTLDMINKAEQGINHIFGMVFSFVMMSAFFLPYVLFMAIWLFTIKPVLAVVIVISMLPCLLTKLLQTGMYAKLEDEVALIRRSFDYYESCICTKEYFKETRILGVTTYFKSLYRDSMILLNKKSLKVDKRACCLDLIGKLIGLLGYFIVLIIFVQALLTGDISVGAFAAIFTAIAKMQEMVASLIGIIGDIGQNSGSINNLLNFLAMPEAQGTEDLDGFKDSIELKDVSFAYPGSNKNSLNQLNLKIHKGETIAIVGQNGAGKSTLVRLLIGIYKPTAGQVLIDGNDTRIISDKSLYRVMSGVFQKFQRYQMSLRENVMMSEPYSKRSEEEIRSVLAKADVDIESRSYVDGIDTMLSREFDGVDLSGGQWQRVAIARGLNRASDIIVLDEPTAAIDPIEETNIYKKFSEISDERTSILVTHQLGSARIADRIIVMDKGNIVEMGDHNTLMQNQGVYYSLFMSQAQWYEKSEGNG